jgi:hypothetical protein
MSILIRGIFTGIHRYVVIYEGCLFFFLFIYHFFIFTGIQRYEVIYEGCLFGKLLFT